MMGDDKHDQENSSKGQYKSTSMPIHGEHRDRYLQASIYFPISFLNLL